MRWRTALLLAACFAFLEEHEPDLLAVAEGWVEARSTGRAPRAELEQ